MINFLNLEYFLVAAEELNFTKAAKKLFISQQSLSNHISNMEKEFDVILFDRTTPLALTYAGQALRARARQLLDLREETYREIADIKDFSVGQLTIGVSHTRGRMVLPEILPLYHARFPNIELKLLEGNTAALDHAILHGKVDLVIGMLPFRVEHVESVPLCEEEILLVVADTVLERAFPGRLQEIKAQLAQNMDLSLLKDCPFLLINQNNRVRSIADEMFDDLEMMPNIVLETENIETVMALCTKGMGITFYPKMFITGHSHLRQLYSSKSDLNFYSLNHRRAHGILAIGYYKGHYMSQAAKEFIRIAQDVFYTDNWARVRR